MVMGVMVVARLTKCVCMCTYLCVYVSGNRFGNAGVTAVAEALKVNTSVQKINLYGE